MVTINDLIENFYRHNFEAGRVNWARVNWRLWKNIMAPLLGGLPADGLTTKVQREYRAARTEAGRKPATINKEFAVLRRAYKLGMIHEPPLVDKMPHFIMAPLNNARKVFIDLGTLQRLRVESAKHSCWMRLAVEMAYTYGWRRGEILSLRNSDVDLFDGTIRLQTSKNGEAREVPITDEIARLLVPVIKDRAPEDFLIWRRAETFEYNWNKVREAAGAMRYKFHDFRRTSAKAKRAAGVPTSVIMELQGWKTEAMFRRYAIVDPSDKKAALRAQAQWEREKMGVPA